MKDFFLYYDDLFSPQILATESDYLVVYKPPKMHSVPGKGTSLVEWCAGNSPEIMQLPKGEGGLLHRLDFETRGLVLFARNQKTLETLFDEQKRGEMVKEYQAFVSPAAERKKGFPPYNGLPLINGNSLTIESFFRPYGPGRKEVRPVEEGAVKTSAGSKKAGGKIYSTEIRETKPTAKNGVYDIRVTIRQGFRHQIRCHLAWAGFPVLNDSVYGGKTCAWEAGNEILALRANGFCFTHPETGEKLRFILPDMDYELNH